MRTVCTKRLHLARIGLVCLIAFGVAGVMVLAVSAAGDSHPVGPASAEAAVPSSIDRDLEPVILTGEDLPLLAGAPTDSLFLYAYRGESWEQIPFQVDEKDGGAYVPTMGSPLDADDEIVFMASDLGARPPDEQVTATLPISPTWYRIEVTDPLSPTKKGWAYVVRSSGLTETFTETYASFDPATDRITTTDYVLGFLSGHPGYDYLALHGSGEDILDRTKLRVRAGTLTITEDDLPAPAPDPTKGGPVRVIVKNRGMMAYRSTFHTWVAEDLSLATAARLSTDFSENASESTFYNATTPLGVTVDGITDTVPAEPLSPWWQVVDDTGTLIQMSDTSGIGGTQTTYYRDNKDVPAPNDTGDSMSYGDTGIYAESPNPTVVYRAALGVLQPGLPNVGSQYALYAANPLQVTVTALFRYRTYVPLVLRN